MEAKFSTRTAKEYDAKEFHDYLNTWINSAKLFLHRCEFDILAFGTWKEVKTGEPVFAGYNGCIVANVTSKYVILMADGEATKCTVVDGAIRVDVLKIR